MFGTAAVTASTPLGHMRGVVGCTVFPFLLFMGGIIQSWHSDFNIKNAAV